MCAQMLTNTHQKNAQFASDSHPTGDAPAPTSSAFSTPSRLQHPLPDQRDHDRRQQHRIEEHAAKEPSPENLAIEHERGDECEPHHQSDLQERELTGVEDRAPEQVFTARGWIEIVVTFEQRFEVVEAGKWTLRRIELNAAGEREIKVDDDRQKGEQAENREIRGDEHPADARDTDETLDRSHRRVDRVERRSRGNPWQRKQRMAVRAHDAMAGDSARKKAIWRPPSPARRCPRRFASTRRRGTFRPRSPARAEPQSG
jgi:hypothetical protein